MSFILLCHNLLPIFIKQEFEFTVENKELFVLQTRTAKRTARASVVIAVDMVREKLTSEREALLRVDANQMDLFLHSMLDQAYGEPGVCCVCIEDLFYLCEINSASIYPNCRCRNELIQYLFYQLYPFSYNS